MSTFANSEDPDEMQHNAAFCKDLHCRQPRREISCETAQIRSPDRVCCVIENDFSYYSTKIYVVGTQKNRLIETVLLSTLNICLI